ncbi:MAG: sigma-70 family RNA polymerase sigma factor [Verrucomicrobiota bacterium]
MSNPEDRPTARTATRASFLDRLCNWDDARSWHRFLLDYGRLIRSLAVRAGLSAAEADDVLQETLVSVARKMPGFVYRPEQCTFESWIRHVTRCRIIDSLRRRRRDGALEPLPATGTGDGPVPAGWGGSAPVPGVDSAWDDAWRRNLLDQALQRLQLRVSPEHFQIFHLAVIETVPGPEVGRLLGVSVAKVYVVRHRLTALLKREVEQLQRRPAGLA